MRPSKKAFNWTIKENVNTATISNQKKKISGTHHLTSASCIEHVRAWPRCRVPVTLGGGKHNTNFLSDSLLCK